MHPSPVYASVLAAITRVIGVTHNLSCRAAHMLRTKLRGSLRYCALLITRHPRAASSWELRGILRSVLP